MRKLVRLLLILFVCMLLLTTNVNAVTLGEYEKILQGYINEVNEKQAAINRTEAEIKETNNQIENIKQEMQKLTEEVTRLHKEISEYNQKIKEKSLQTKEIFQYFQMANGENVYMEYVFGAESITDLIYRVAIVEQMTEYNNKITKELEEMIESNKNREKEIEIKNKELSQKKEELDKKLIFLGQSKESLKEGAVNAQGQIAIYEEIVAGYKRVGCLSHHVIGVDCAVATAAEFKRPVSWGYITSEFGGRWGSFHRGLDISNWDPYNTKIYPVANGTITAKYYDNYGALVIAIEHYDAIDNQYYTSLYAHMSSYAPNLYVGKSVTPDDYIGYMGNTGYSTGPHLHIEIAPCRLYKDSNCYSWDAYVAFVQRQANLGYKGPRQLISFPSIYTYWYNK